MLAVKTDLLRSISSADKEGICPTPLQEEERQFFLWRDSRRFCWLTITADKAEINGNSEFDESAPATAQG
uniref:Uncharacterized protein n=1 Tax=Ditylenchus dipsaci TaxID=166011 RepID=A0A915E5M6_9BILA